MDLCQKKEELIALITGFLDNTKSINEIQNFVWDIIDYFTNTPDNYLPPEEDFENIFWYAIWQIQHLCTDDHLANGSAHRALKETNAYLKGTKEIPSYCFGKRP